MINLQEANTPKPQKPDCIDPYKWTNYCDDLACWMADQAERRRHGIVE